MAKKFTLTEEQFVMLNSYALRYLNRTIHDLKNIKFESSENVTSKYYQREIDECANVLASIEHKYNVDEITYKYYENKLNNQ